MSMERAQRERERERERALLGTSRSVTSREGSAFTTSLPNRDADYVFLWVSEWGCFVSE